jgi:hypothetical protein
MKLRKRFWRFTPLKVSHGVAPVLRFHGAGTGRDSTRMAPTQGLRRAEPACCCPGPTQLLVYWELLHRHPSTGGVRIAIDRMDRQAIRVLSRLGDSLGTQARQVRWPRKRGDHAQHLCLTNRWRHGARRSAHLTVRSLTAMGQKEGVCPNFLKAGTDPGGYLVPCSR